MRAPRPAPNQHIAHWSRTGHWSQTKNWTRTWLRALLRLWIAVIIGSATLANRPASADIISNNLEDPHFIKVTENEASELRFELCLVETPDECLHQLGDRAYPRAEIGRFLAHRFQWLAADTAAIILFAYAHAEGIPWLYKKGKVGVRFLRMRYPQMRLILNNTSHLLAGPEDGFIMRSRDRIGRWKAAGLQLIEQTGVSPDSLIKPAIFTWEIAKTGETVHLISRHVDPKWGERVNPFLQLRQGLSVRKLSAPSARVRKGLAIEEYAERINELLLKISELMEQARQFSG